MAGELRNYDSDRITIIWSITGGATVDLAQGLIDGPGAVVESKDAPRWSRKTDRQGNTVRNRSRKRGGSLTLTYIAEAEIHDQLTLISNLDDQLENQVGTIVIKDLEGTTIARYVGAFIEDDPVLNYGDTAADRAYVFGYSERLPNFGGANAL